MKKSILYITLPLFLLLIVIAVSYRLNTGDTIAPTNSEAQSVPAQLATFWDGKAEWKFYKALSLEGDTWTNTQTLRYGYANAHIEVVDGVWYMFSRKYYTEKCMNGEPKTGTEVRKSTNKGITWSDPVNIVVPTVGKAWECQGTDGDAYYDKTTTTWHYMFQCMGKLEQWNGCYLQLKQKEPMKLFAEVHPNPVTMNRSLFSKLCNKASDDCVGIPAQDASFVRNEGTFYIFKSAKASLQKYYYVSFHGFDGKHGFTGIAATKDFKKFVVGNGSIDLPVDVSFDLYDANEWNEKWAAGTSIGAGGNTFVYENGYYYLLQEATDKSLVCIRNDWSNNSYQKWNIGLLRSQTLNNLNWEQLPAGNPFIFSSESTKEPYTCTPSYSRIFQDDITQEWFLQVSRGSVELRHDGIFLYKLVHKANILVNGDLSLCTSTGWSAINGPSQKTNVKVYRKPNESSDYNCYLAANCDLATCNAAQSIYQDVSVIPLAQTKIRFGGKLSLQTGSKESSRGLLRLYQFDATGQVLKSDDIEVTPRVQGYRSYEKTVSLHRDTTRIRYQLYLGNDATFELDEAFVVLQ